MIHYMTIRGIADAWVGNELRIVTKAGIPFKLHSLIQIEQNYFKSEDIAQMRKETNVLYPLPKVTAVLNVLAGPFRFGTRFFSALWNALTGERESFRNRLVGIVHFCVACTWATQLRKEDVSHIHSQWIHSAGTVAMYGAWLTGKPFSFTGHAADLFRERSALKDKVRRADFIICISEFHRDLYLKEGARPEQLKIAYCGIDTSHFTPRRRTRPTGEPFHIISAGRLVEKKGFTVLIEACRILAERGLKFRCTIGGSGPLENDLRAQISSSGLDNIVTMTGQELKQEAIPDFMLDGDVYTLPCVWAKDNDVDGLPQMLMEAMACGLPAVSTRLVGIPDLVRHEETGLLVEPHDAVGLADALQELAMDEVKAIKLAEAGRKHLVNAFDLSTCLEPLLTQYRAALEAKS